MSKVDLSKAKASDVLHFRCGGNAEIKSVFKSFNYYRVSLN
jgi:hypothetical protein